MFSWWPPGCRAESYKLPEACSSDHHIRLHVQYLFKCSLIVSSSKKCEQFKEAHSQGGEICLPQRSAAHASCQMSVFVRVSSLCSIAGSAAPLCKQRWRGKRPRQSSIISALQKTIMSEQLQFRQETSGRSILHRRGGGLKEKLTKMTKVTPSRKDQRSVVLIF